MGYAGLAEINALYSCQCFPWRVAVVFIIVIGIAVVSVWYVMCPIIIWTAVRAIMTAWCPYGWLHW
ncbi:hypothetical protein ADH70_006410 [Blautia pseudococcoides]|uniref:Uncharacterized protein n=1 Tax=Blautia pseudococcoides TaxID=1796616 RepID=A0A1C7IBW5_9FIRM|nr:hypothetical protein A4V09_08030 [Blautia pseudococcoides]ASU28525.1 hypothetical protein ADH70_006410 [Blautia pseudococcoides]